MKLKVFSIRDSKAEVFNTPFFQKTHGEAERSFREVIADTRSMPSKYPEDYDLYYLGEWDDQTGQMEICDTPQHVIKAVQVKSQLNDPMVGLNSTQNVKLALNQSEVRN